MYDKKELIVRGGLEMVKDYYTISLIIPKTKERVQIKLLHYSAKEKFRQSLNIVKIKETGEIFQPRGFTTHYRQTKTGGKISLHRLLSLLLDYPTIMNWGSFRFPVSIKIRYEEDKQAKSFIVENITVYFYTRHNWQGDRFAIYTNRCSNCVFFKCFLFYVNDEEKDSANFFGLAKHIIELAKPYLKL